MIRNDYLITRWVFCKPTKYKKLNKCVLQHKSGIEAENEEGKSAKWWKNKQEILYLL